MHITSQHSILKQLKHFSVHTCCLLFLHPSICMNITNAYPIRSYIKLSQTYRVIPNCVITMPSYIPIECYFNFLKIFLIFIILIRKSSIRPTVVTTQVSRNPTLQAKNKILYHTHSNHVLPNLSYWIL